MTHTLKFADVKEQVHQMIILKLEQNKTAQKST